MNGLHLLIGLVAILTAASLIVAIVHHVTRPQPKHADPDIEVLLREVEALRRMIQRDTGREISELRLRGGHWYAITSRGEELVADMLRRGRHNILEGVQP